MHGPACTQYIFQSYYTSSFNAMRFDGAPFTCQCENENEKAYKSFQVGLLTVVLKWHHSSEGVNLCFRPFEIRQFKTDLVV